MLILGGVALAVSARYIWRATAVYRATQISDGATAGSLGRATGTVEHADERIVAPFSAAECVALRSEIEERRLSVLYLLPWYVTLYEATSAVPFTLETAAGTVSVVEPAHTVTLTRDTVETCGPNETPPERIQRFESDHDDVSDTTLWRDPPSVLAPLFGLLSLGTRRYREQRADVGTDVTVVGRVTADGIDPLVVSDRTPGQTMPRMAKIAVAGLLIGLVGCLLGVVLILKL
ncbi:hypothetical protein [Halovenus marina]|uniref:hypothetical protein n=1 Tax=Halovenus marina TaxID=3396621 RepID=UPI003F54CA6F